MRLKGLPRVGACQEPQPRSVRQDAGAERKERADGVQVSGLRAQGSWRSRGTSHCEQRRGPEVIEERCHMVVIGFARVSLSDLHSAHAAAASRDHTTGRDRTEGQDSNRRDPRLHGQKAHVPMSTGGVRDCSETGRVSCFVGEGGGGDTPQACPPEPGPPPRPPLPKRAEPGFPFRRIHGHLVPV